MKKLISGYTHSCTLVKSRIGFLTNQRNELRKQGDFQQIELLNLEQRIRLLYAEYEQMQEIIEHLNNYSRRIEQRAET